MSDRTSVVDFMGARVFEGDVITYSTRRGVRVRNTAGLIKRIYFKRVDGRTEPRLLVQPIADSGYHERKTPRAVNISTEHIALYERGES